MDSAIIQDTVTAVTIMVAAGLTFGAAVRLTR